MNDFDYDVKEKKRIARGAYAKVNGSRSKRCTLPGDYLTPAQKKKLSTTLVDVNLKRPMTWDQFKALPTDIKKEYLTFLRDDCHGTLTSITQMFGIARTSYNHHINRHEPTLKLLFNFTGRTSKEDRAIWRAWLAGEDTPVVIAPVDVPVEDDSGRYFRTYTPKAVAAVDETPAPEPEDNTPILPIPSPSRLSFTYEGEISAEELRDAINFYAKFGPVKNISVSFEL